LGGGCTPRRGRAGAKYGWDWCQSGRLECGVLKLGLHAIGGGIKVENPHRFGVRDTWGAQTRSPLLGGEADAGGAEALEARRSRVLFVESKTSMHVEVGDVGEKGRRYDALSWKVAEESGRDEKTF
jgi:hypothetical protein